MTSIFIHCVHYVRRYSGSVTAITLVWTCLPHSYLLQSCVDTRSCADSASLLVMNSVTLGMSQGGSIFIHGCRECFWRIFTFLWTEIVTDQDRRHMTVVVMTPAVSHRSRAFTIVLLRLNTDINTYYRLLKPTFHIVITFMHDKYGALPLLRSCNIFFYKHCMYFQTCQIKKYTLSLTRHVTFGRMMPKQTWGPAQYSFPKLKVKMIKRNPNVWQNQKPTGAWFLFH